MIKIFFDDTRDPEDVYPLRKKEISNSNWKIARNLNQFKNKVEKAIENEQNIFISFDHDINENETGMDAVKWLIKKDIVPVDFYVHSANIVGAKNIEGYMKNWISFNKKNNQ